MQLVSSAVSPSPLLSYLTLGILVVGLAVCFTSCVGCWAGLAGGRGGVVMVRGGRVLVECENDFLQVIIFLVILMIGEVSVAVLAIVAKSLLETDLERELLTRLREEYNMVDAEVFTRAVDLAQTQVSIFIDSVVSFGDVIFP